MNFKKSLLVAIMVACMVAVTACGGNPEGEQPGGSTEPPITNETSNPENPPVDDTVEPETPEEPAETLEPEVPEEPTDTNEEKAN